jgi:hypothetical protein
MTTLHALPTLDGPYNIEATVARLDAWEARAQRDALDFELYDLNETLTELYNVACTAADCIECGAYSHAVAQDADRFKADGVATLTAIDLQLDLLGVRTPDRRAAGRLAAGHPAR